MLSSTDEIWFYSMQEIANRLDNGGFRVHKQPAFEPNAFDKSALREIKRSGVRITILMAYDSDMIDVASEATLQEMTTAGWAWILTEGVVDARRQATQMAGWIYVQPLCPSQGMQAFAKNDSNLTKWKFNKDTSPDSVDLTYSAALHDAIRLYAHAVTNVLSEGGDLSNGTVVTEAVRKTSFVGAGGHTVVLDTKGDRIESYEVLNYGFGAENVMDSVSVGIYDSVLEQLLAKQAVVWPGNTTMAPTDRAQGASCRTHLSE